MGGLASDRPASQVRRRTCPNRANAATIFSPVDPDDGGPQLILPGRRSGSLSVAVGLAGSFCGWALLLVAADAAVILVTTGSVGGTVPVYVRHMLFRHYHLLARAFMAAVCGGVPLLSAFLLSRSPLYGWQLAVGALGYYTAGAGLSLFCCGRPGGLGLAGRAVALYAVWGFAESFVGLLAAYGLKKAGSSH